MNNEMDKGPLNHAISPWHSIGVRLSLSVLGVAIGVLVVGLLVYIYFQEDQVKEKTMMLAEMQLTEQICEAEKLMVGDTTLTDKEKEDSVMRIIQSIKPYKHSYCILLDSSGHYLLHPDPQLALYGKDSTTLDQNRRSFKEL